MMSGLKYKVKEIFLPNSSNLYFFILYFNFASCARQVNNFH